MVTNQPEVEKYFPAVKVAARHRTSLEICGLCKASTRGSRPWLEPVQR